MCILTAATVLPVIAARPSVIPYLSALLPSELELQTLEETDSSEQDDQTDGENTAGNAISVSLTAWAQSLTHQVSLWGPGFSMK